MTPFDEEFADRAREVFDAYREPADPAALARMRAALGHGRAPDRAPVASVRRRRRALAALAVLVAAVGAWGLAEWGAGAPAPAEIAAGPEAVADRAEADRAGVDEAADPEPTAPVAATRAGSAAATARAEPPPVAAALPPREAPPPVPAGEAEPVADSVVDFPDVLAVSASEPVAVGEERAGPLAPSVSEAPAPAAAPLAQAPREPRPSALSVVVATTSVFVDGDLTEGAGVSAGLAVERRVGRGVTVSAGAAASLRRAVLGPRGVTAAQAFDLASQRPDRPVDVTDQTTVTTVALDVPLDVAVDVVRTRRGRLRAAVGLTSTLYLAQTFEDAGTTYRAAVVPASEGQAVVLSGEPFDTRTAERALSRLDLGRQLNLGLGVAGGVRQPLAVDVVARLPLGGLTSRDLRLTTVGVRVRVGL